MHTDSAIAFKDRWHRRQKNGGRKINLRTAIQNGEIRGIGENIRFRT
jgi:hypothetical protein